MSRKFIAAAIVDKISTMADNSLRLYVDCQEMAPEREAVILSMRRKPGYFLFGLTDDLADEIDIPNFSAPDGKSPSKRLRSVLYLLWDRNGRNDLYNITCEFNDYYKQVMERLINKYKERL